MYFILSGNTVKAHLIATFFSSYSINFLAKKNFLLLFVLNYKKKSVARDIKL